MAIEYARITIHSRSKGLSSVASAAYRAGERLLDERTGETHDFTNRTDVVHSEIMLPDGGLVNYEDREVLWNAVEASEKRRDSQVAKEIVFALPKELNLTENKELIRRFVHYHYVQNGLVADINIHDKGDSNPHAHVLLTTRRLEKDGFSRYKARDLNPKFSRGKITEQDYVSKLWRDFQNEYFIEIGRKDLSVDLNHLVPEKHEGRIRASEHYLKEHNDDVKAVREEIALNHIDNFVNLVSLKASVFTRRDIEKLLFKSILNHESHDFPALVERIMQHADVVELGVGDDGKLRFTTKQHYVAESRLFGSIEKLEANKAHVISQDLSKELAGFGLREEQLDAIHHISQSGGISSVVGLPGAGKSYMLKALKSVYQDRGYEVIGSAVSDKVTKALKADTGLNAYTLSSLNYRLDMGYLKLKNNSLIVVDEAGMVDFAQYANVIEEVKKAGAKLVLVGDPNQLKPVGKGDLFRGIVERIGAYSMVDIKRQVDALDRKASRALCRGDIDFALTHYEGKGALTWSDTRELSIEMAADNWSKDVEINGLESSAMLAFTRAAVQELNTKARENLIDRRLLDTENVKTFEVIRGDKQLFKNDMQKLEEKLMPNSTESRIEPIELAIGERLIFSKKDKTLGIDNGDIGSVTALNNDSFAVKLTNGSLVSIPASTYKYYDYAYALTVHKSQGMTVKNAHVVFDSKYWDKYLSLVAMTRHKENLKLYASHSLHKLRDKLVTMLSRGPIKDNIIDWPINFALRHGFDPDSIVGRAVNHIAGAKEKIKDAWSYVVNYEGYLKKQEWAVSLEKKQQYRATAKRSATYEEHQRSAAKYHKKVQSYSDIKKAPEELQVKLYVASLKRDKAAYELWANDKAPIENDELKGVVLEKVLKASNRYKDYQVIRQYFEQTEASIKENTDYMQKLNQVDLDASYMHIKHFANEKKLDSTKVYQDIERCQKYFRKEYAKKLRRENPILESYYELEAQRVKSTGYYKTAIEKKMSKVAKDISKNKQLYFDIKQNMPNVYKSLGKSLSLGRDRGRDGIEL